MTKAEAVAALEEIARIGRGERGEFWCQECGQSTQSDMLAIAERALGRTCEHEVRYSYMQPQPCVLCNQMVDPRDWVDRNPSPEKQALAREALQQAGWPR